MADELEDVVEQLGRRVAHAITPGDAMPGQDAMGVSVSSLTEAVMGLTAGLLAIAHAIDALAEAIRESEG